MANQLHQVIGAILVDIVQARATADRYSRDLSKTYGEDNILRLFPVPRADIKDITIDLKFAIANVEPDPERTTNKEAVASTIIMESASEIVSAFTALITNEAAQEVWPERVLRFLKGETYHKVLTRAMVDFGAPEIAEAALRQDRGVFNVAKAARRAANLLFTRTQRLLREPFPDLEAAEVASKVRQTLANRGTPAKGALEPLFAEVKEEVDRQIESVEDIKVELLTTASELQELPEAAISSLRFNTGLRDYIWRHTEEDIDGEKVRRLIPES